jgi:hypothetical protein
VFAFLSTPTTIRSGTAVSWTSSAFRASGVRATRSASRVPAATGSPAEIDITEMTAGEIIAFQTVAGPVRPRGRYVLAATDGGTRVRFELEADMPGFERLMAPMVQRTTNHDVASSPR